MTVIGKRLKDARADRGCTAEEVAKACGITVTAVYMYENGHRIPRDETKQRLSDFYGISVQNLFFN